MRLKHYLIEAEGLEELRKWGETFGKNHGVMPDEHGFFDMCVKHMKDKVDDAEAYCARVKDAAYGSTMWRGKGKSKAEIAKDVKKHPLKEEVGVIDEMTKKVIYSCKVCDHIKKCKFKNLHDGIPENCPLKKEQ